MSDHTPEGERVRWRLSVRPRGELLRSVGRRLLGDALDLVDVDVDLVGLVALPLLTLIVTLKVGDDEGGS